METAKTVREIREPAKSALPLEAQHERLLALVADLLLENQRLSREIEWLEQKIAQLQKGQLGEMPWAGMLI